MMNKNIYQIIFLISGIIFILFGSTYMFTKPAIWKEFDFSETGQIGDTIGGITAPIINLIGAILVYLSFKAQINANTVQFKLLNKESENQIQNDNFKLVIELFKELKADYKNLEYLNYTGQGALNAYIYEISSKSRKEDLLNHLRKPIYFDWKFIMAEYDLITNHLATAEFRTDEKNKISDLIINYYIIQLEYSVKVIKDKLLEFEIESDILQIISKFDAEKTKELIQKRKN